MKRPAIGPMFLFLALILSSACSTTSHRVTPPDGAAQLEIFNGRTVQVWEVKEGDLFEQEVEESLVADAVAMEAVAATANTPNPSDIYKGTQRKKAKISIVDGPIENFDSIGEFLDSVPLDEEMLELRISKSADSGRIDLEMRNVRFPCFLLASSKPGDNDYHLILGDDPEEPSELLNVEVSGLPLFPRDDDFTSKADAERLRLVRQFYQSTMGSLLPTSRYKFYFPGIDVTVTGSIFFDTAHRPGQVGPKDLRPDTSWELHPVTFIEFH